MSWETIISLVVSVAALGVAIKSLRQSNRFAQAQLKEQEEAKILSIESEISSLKANREQLIRQADIEAGRAVESIIEVGLRSQMHNDYKQKINPQLREIDQRINTLTNTLNELKRKKL